MIYRCELQSLYDSVWTQCFLTKNFRHTQVCVEQLVGYSRLTISTIITVEGGYLKGTYIEKCYFEILTFEVFYKYLLYNVQGVKFFDYKVHFVHGQ